MSAALKHKPYPVYKASGVDWLGQIPESWTRTRIKRLAALGYKTFVDGDWIESPFIRDDGIRLLQTGNIGIGVYKEQGYRYIDQATFSAFRCTEVRTDDVLICRLAHPVGRACLAPDLGVRKITSVDVCILKPSPQHDERFIVYFLSSPEYLTAMGAISRGGTRDRISRSMLGDTEFVAPPLPEQRAIADFLDRETQRIDRLIEKKRRLIELLEEKRSALISHAVTKGLDPNAPMKPSGIAWLGEIPAHWDCVALAYRTISRCDGPFGSGLKSNHYTALGVRVVRLQNIGSAAFHDGDAAYVSKSHAAGLGDHSVYAGDLLVAGLGDEGHPVSRACVAPQGLGPAMVKADCFRFRLDTDRLLPQFTAYQLSATAKAVSACLSTGATRSRVNLTTVASLRVAHPAVPEQRTIVAHLERTGSRTQAIVQRVQEAIAKLQEYRTALISAAVTGKIDVRASGGSAPAGGERRRGGEVGDVGIAGGSCSAGGEPRRGVREATS